MGRDPRRIGGDGVRWGWATWVGGVLLGLGVGMMIQDHRDQIILGRKSPPPSVAEPYIQLKITQCTILADSTGWRITPKTRNSLFDRDTIYVGWKR